MNKKESSLKAFFGKETLERKIKRLRREKMNRKGKEPIWEIVEWILIILVIVLVIFLIFKFDIINKIKDIFPSFGK